MALLRSYELLANRFLKKDEVRRWNCLYCGSN